MRGPEAAHWVINEPLVNKWFGNYPVGLLLAGHYCGVVTEGECRVLLLSPWLRCASRGNADFASLNSPADLSQFPPNRCRPFLQDCRDVTALPDHRHDGNESRSKGHVHDVVLTNRIQQQRGATCEFLAVASICRKTGLAAGRPTPRVRSRQQPDPAYPAESGRGCIRWASHIHPCRSRAHPRRLAIQQSFITSARGWPASVNRQLSVESSLVSRPRFAAGDISGQVWIFVQNA